MNSPSRTSGLDWLKWILVFALVAAAILGNWYLGDQSLLNRVLAIIAITVVALLIASQTEKGSAVLTLLKEARNEIRRVVWPTRQETTQTTFIVILLVIVFAIILWGLDSLLSWLVSTVIG